MGSLAGQTICRMRPSHLKFATCMIPRSTSISVTFRPSKRIISRQNQLRTVSTYGYEQSKALILYEHGAPQDVLHLHSYSISPPHSALVTLRLLASPINPADVNMIQGTYASLSPKTTNLSTQNPAAVPGNEGVAEVVSAGASAFVTAPDQSISSPKDGQRNQDAKYKKGDRVLFRKSHAGTFRTHVQLESSAIFPLPSPSDASATPLSNTQAATLCVNPVTAWALLKGQTTSSTSNSEPSSEATNASAPKSGEWIAQNAANSAVGRAVIQLARAWGVNTLNIIRARPDAEGKPGSGEAATVSLKEELKALGATYVFTEEEAAEKGFSQHVSKNLTNENAIKLAFNAVGGRSALNLAKLISGTPGARHITYGAMAKQPLTIPAGMLIFSDIRFEGFWVSRWGQANPSLKETAIAEAVDLISTGQFKDAPVQEVKWTWETTQENLVKAVQDSVAGDGFAAGKKVFVFENT